MPEFIEIPPDPSNEIQMLSKIGYTLETALSDIIDNSISAGAKNIEILSLPKEEIFWSVIDDGIGMDSSELIENMRIGCKDPTKEREQMDLGRFGAGMKTASISQAKEVTVFSKTKTSKLSAAKWDVEKICEAKKWNLQLLSQKEYPSFDYLKLENNRSGTQVCWENLSRYSEQDHLIAERLHAEDIVRVKKHLSIHFHKFMSGKNKIKFTVNGDLLKPTDPFMSNLNGYDEGPSSEFRIKNNERIYIKVHNIPHWSKLSKENLDFYGGQSEITKKQGLYIYRANRLIIEGGWMGLTGNSQLGDLARVEINIPVSLDEEWKTDVKKSSLQLPPKIKTMLREMIRTPINKSKRTYKYRGSKEESNPYWIKRKNEREDIFTYEINNENQELISLLEKMNKKDYKLLGAYLKKLALNLPINDIYYQMNDKPLDLKQEFLEEKYKNDADIINAILEQMND